MPAPLQFVEPQHVGTNLDYLIDLTNDFATSPTPSKVLTGATITPLPADVTISNVSFSGAKIIFWAAATVVGLHRLTIAFTTSDGGNDEIVALLKVIP